MKNFYFIFLKIRKTIFLLLAFLAVNFVFSLSAIAQTNNSQTSIIAKPDIQTSKDMIINNDSLIINESESKLQQSEIDIQNTANVQDTLSTQPTEEFVRVPAQRMQAVRKINAAVEKIDSN